MCTVCSRIIASLVVFFFGVLVSFLYWFLQQRKEIEIEQSRSWFDPTLVKLEYEQLSQGIRARDNLTIIAGTILITASVLLLGTCTELASNKNITFKTKLLLISVSLLIYTIWLICFNLTSKILNNISYRRLERIEEFIDMELHQYIIAQIEEKRWWNYLRRPVWLYFLWILIGVSIAILWVPF